MELEDLNKYVENASKEKLEALGFLGQWLMGLKPRYCTCACKCDMNCELVQALGGALQSAGQKLQG